MADPSPKPKEKKTAQSKDFRIIFANLFTIRFGDNDVLVKFAMEEDASDLDAPNIEEVGVVMTPRSAKLFAHALTEAINAFEAALGSIQVPQSKLDGITESIRSRVAEAASPEK
jgi:Protein of unknown function (DUF3467)